MYTTKKEYELIAQQFLKIWNKVEILNRHFY